MPDEQLSELNHRFAIEGKLKFERHQSGLIVGRIATADCVASFFLLGAHVAEFQPSTQTHPVLFMSDEAVYEIGKPIRGGIPICFPWFGPNKLDTSLPAHGTVRIAQWEMLGSSQTDRGVSVTLGYQAAPFHVELTVCFGQSLDVAFAATNQSAVEQSCEVALHTYFQLGDARRASVSGLELNEFRDQLTGQIHGAAGQPIRFIEETDRVYRGAVPLVTINDEANHRRIQIAPRSSQSTVVWNPWIAKSQRMPDFGDQEFERMCCVETANVAGEAWQLKAGETRTVGFEISVANVDAESH